MPNDKDDLKNFPNTPQGSRDAGSYEASRYSSPAPKQSWETQQDANRRQDEFERTKRGY